MCVRERERDREREWGGQGRDGERKVGLSCVRKQVSKRDGKSEREGERGSVRKIYISISLSLYLNGATLVVFWEWPNICLAAIQISDTRARKERKWKATCNWLLQGTNLCRHRGEFKLESEHIDRSIGRSIKFACLLTTTTTTTTTTSTTGAAISTPTRGEFWVDPETSFSRESASKRDDDDEAMLLLLL